MIISDGDIEKCSFNQRSKKCIWAAHKHEALAKHHALPINAKLSCQLLVDSLMHAFHVFY